MGAGTQPAMAAAAKAEGSSLLGKTAAGPAGFSRKDKKAAVVVAPAALSRVSKSQLPADSSDSGALFSCDP